MKYEADIYQMTVEGHTFWVAESKVLKGCVGQGDTSDEAIKELEQNEVEWLKTAADMDMPIPQATSKNTTIPSGKFALRLAPNIYSESYNIANELNLSLNQYFCNAILHYNDECNIYLRSPISDEIEDTNNEESATILQFNTSGKNNNDYVIKASINLEEM